MPTHQNPWGFFLFYLEDAYTSQAQFSLLGVLDEMVDLLGYIVQVTTMRSFIYVWLLLSSRSQYQFADTSLAAYLNSAPCIMHTGKKGERKLLAGAEGMVSVQGKRFGVVDLQSD